MAQTIVGLNDPKAVRRYSGALAVDAVRQSYFTSKFMSTSDTQPIQRKTDLETAAGHEITYDLSLQLRGEPTEGLSKQKLEGAEEDLSFATDRVFIDQQRHGVNAGDKMTRKRTLHNLRDIAKARLADWWARMYDEQVMMYAAGSRGTNDDYIIRSLNYNGRANNPFTAPDDRHLIYAGAVTSKAGLTANDTISLELIDRLKAKAATMGGGTQALPKIQPIMINGGKHYVYLMTPTDEYNLRRSSTSNEWMDLQKAAAAAEGKKNPIFTGSLGMYNDVILHSHQAVVRFNDYGAGGDVEAARNLFMGRQALCMAFGTPGGGMTFDWHEETDDRGNELVVDTESIYGLKKSTYEIKQDDGSVVARDFGIIAADVASAPL